MELTTVFPPEVVAGLSATADMNKALPKFFAVDGHVLLGTNAVVDIAAASSKTAEDTTEENRLETTILLSNSSADRNFDDKGEGVFCGL